MRLAVAIVSALLAAAPARGAVTVAVSYFDNDTAREDLAPLSKGLADMLITDLSNVSSIRIVEREKLNAVLGELKLSKSRFIDPKTAQKLGKGLAAQYILTGSYVVQGEAFRIDAKVVKVESGVVAAAQKVEGTRDEFFAMEKELVDLLVSTLSLKLGFSEKGKLRSNQTESFDAWAKYSAGLDAKDKGDSQKAQQLFLEALRADPNYKAARTAGERLAALYQKVDDETSRSWDVRFAGLDVRSAQFPGSVEQLLMDAESTRPEGMKRKITLLTWLAERDLYPQTIPQLNRVALDAIALAGRFDGCPGEWDAVIGTCDYFAARIPKDVTVLNTCRSHLQLIHTFRKTPSQAEHLQATWAEDETHDLQLDSDDWRNVLARNHAGIIALMRLYASKAKR